MLSKLLKVKTFVVIGLGLLTLMFFWYFWNYTNTSVTVVVPVSRNDILFKDGNVDISIQRVDEIHVHQQLSLDKAEDHHNKHPHLGEPFVDRIPKDGFVVPSLKLNDTVFGLKIPGQGGSRSLAGAQSKPLHHGGTDVTVHQQQPSYNHQHFPYDSSMIGMVNYDIWHWIVGYLVDDMRLSRDFPLHPDERQIISRIHSHFNEADPADVRGRYAHKISGYILPAQKGTYSFKVEMTDVTAASEIEFWISTDTDPLSINKVVNLIYADLKRPVKRTPVSLSRESMEISLNSEAHYFEFLEKAYEGKITSEIKWKIPLSNEYVPIPKSCLAMAIKLDRDGNRIEGPATHFLEGDLPSNHLQSHHHAHSLSNTIYPITDLDILPTCEFKAMYAKPRRIKRYSGVYQVHESKVEPRDDTWFRRWTKRDRGNSVIAANTVNVVVSLYKQALNASEKYEGEVIRLRYMEETKNKRHGSRFLLEMDVQLTHPRNEVVHTSEYVYWKKSSTSLCHTFNFQWTKNVEVFFVISVKNLGLWVKHLIYNMEDIYEYTHDEHFSLIIVDYGSQDMDIAEEAKKSSFKRIQVMHLKGSFSRSGGLQAGIDSVEDPNHIVMTIDMHLTLPLGIVEYIRRHTVQYKMAFTPMFFRLNEGYTEINYNGFWETLTYGLFAMYKSDWTKFGGFDTRRYRSKWGGEDWDILDRSLAKGFEAFRIRPPGLVHYHHTRTGMWGNKDIKIAKKWTLN